MSNTTTRRIGRRRILKGVAATVGAAAVGGGAYWVGSVSRVSRSLGHKVIVIGIDGMDPTLCREMMEQGQLPNLTKMSAAGGFSSLGTSVPPQSPVAWANFINGSDPGSHGIFDFIHRRPEEQCAPYYSAAETLPGEGFLEIGDCRLQLDFWPFNHQPPRTVLKRQGVPFWDYLDAAGIPSTFYDLPSNYPPGPSQYGNHRCLSGMGTPDMLGSYGTYQLYCEDGPDQPVDEGGGIRSRLDFEGESARVQLRGPDNTFQKEPIPTALEFAVHRDRQANAALIELQGRRLLLAPGQWSPWLRVSFSISLPSVIPDQKVSGICRLLLQEVAPNFRLYVSPINIDPSDPAIQMSEPSNFSEEISRRLGLFYTTGFQEDHKARSNGVFSDDEFLRQATHVLDERLALFEYAVDNYDDGLLFFYFSSSDLQSHMFWWNSDDPHPIRSDSQARKFHGHIKHLYQRLDAVVGDIYDRYGSRATIIVMSDHGFANFGRQFNLNSWLRDFGFLNPRSCSSIHQDADWSRTRAYGLGINGLYLNLKGRERNGIVEPGKDQERLTRQLMARLQAVRDYNGQKVIRRVYRSDQTYSKEARKNAPDLILGYARGYRASWSTCLGELTPEVLMDNDSAWSADHCADALEVPGMLCCNRQLRIKQPTLMDLAPSILAEYGLSKPRTMKGNHLFSA
jgi:predicted AlkP superfamily phosphohydrolase/phosphomutase